MHYFSVTITNCAVFRYKKDFFFSTLYTCATEQFRICKQ